MVFVATVSVAMVFVAMRASANLHGPMINARTASVRAVPRTYRSLSPSPPPSSRGGVRQICTGGEGVRQICTGVLTGRVCGKSARVRSYAADLHACVLTGRLAANLRGPCAHWGGLRQICIGTLPRSSRSWSWPSSS